MSTTVNIQPVTRIEGHARVAIHLDQDGNVADAKFHVMALRGFEKFTEGFREAVAFAGNGVAIHAPGTVSSISDAVEQEEEVAGVTATEFSDVDFDELGSASPAEVWS